MRAARKSRAFLNSLALNFEPSSSPSSTWSAAIWKASATFSASAPCASVLSSARAAAPSEGSASRASTFSSTSASVMAFLSSLACALAAGSRISRTARTLRGRDPGILLRRWAVSSSSSLLTQPRGAVTLGAAAAWVRWAMARSTALSAAKGGLPERISKSTAPNA